MSKENLIKKFYKINRELYEKAKNPLPSHGPEHHCRVLANALEIAKEFKGVDFEVLIPACLLHDIGTYQPEKSGKKHSLNSSIKAKKILNRCRFSLAKRRRILEAITNHGSDSELKNKKESIETTILRDADKIEAFGPLGVARIIMARSLSGDSLSDIAKKYYSGDYLERKWSSITILKARRMASKNYRYSLKFFSGLAGELGLNSEKD